MENKDIIMEKKENQSFFRPWIGTDYKKGFLGRRTMVVGVCHICTTECQFHDECKHTDMIWMRDYNCPCYKDREDQEYYHLSNSNYIEIQSFIDGEAAYPAYKIFTYYMLHKAGIILDHEGELTENKRKKLWNMLAFTNFLQFFHDNNDALPNESAVYESAYPALMEAVADLNAEIILIWDKRVMDCIKRHKEDFTPLGKVDIPYGLEVYLFLPKGSNITGNERTKLKSKWGIEPSKHEIKWYRDLLKTYFGKHTQFAKLDKDEVKDFARKLKTMVSKGLLLVDGENLRFNSESEYKWNSVLIAFFLKAIKMTYKSFGRGTNPAIEDIFGLNIATNSCDVSHLKCGREKATLEYLHKTFPKSKNI